MSDSDIPADVSPASEAPITAWLRQLEAGDAAAAEPLFEHFCQRLHDLARQRIPANIRTVYDHDDVAASAFHSLFLGVRQQRYQLRGRTDLWRLLLTIAERKICRRIQHELRDKRDVRRTVQQSCFLQLPNDKADDPRPGLESLAGREPTPEFAAEVAETCDGLLASLPDEKSRQIALLRLKNYTADEIAEKLNCSRRTVQRKLLVIRLTWQKSTQSEADPNELSQSGDK